MRNDKHLATELRKQGKGYNKINKELGIPKSTLASWFSKSKWSIKIKKELERKANYIAKKRLLFFVRKRQKEWEKWRESFRKEARKEFPSLISDPLFTAGINLYWGEGDSKLKNGIVRLVNTDPRMLSLFVKFLRKFCKIPDDKILACMTLYPDLNEKKCRLFWSNSTNISPHQFRKTQFIKGRHPTKKVERGMCTILIHSRGLKEKIYTWIDLFAKEM
jgi:hypothetical protein